MTKAKKPQLPTQCSIPWEDMIDVDGRIKHCSTCEKDIYPVRTKAEFDQAMLEGKCVWFDRGSNAPPLEFGMVHRVIYYRPLPPGVVGGVGGSRVPKGGKTLVWED